jgi:hypothetical protein
MSLGTFYGVTISSGMLIWGQGIHMKQSGQIQELNRIFLGYA